MVEAAFSSDGHSSKYYIQKGFMSDFAGHITSERLELLSLSPAELGEEERTSIERHLGECAFCREEADEWRAYYDHLAARLASPPSEREERFVRRLLSSGNLVPSRRAHPERTIDRALDAYVEILGSPETSLSQRVARYVVRHPAKVVGGFGLAAAIVASLLFIRSASRDINPTSAKVRNYLLSVYNKHGDVLWTEHVPGIPDDSGGVNLRLAGDRNRLLAVEDVDGDGRNEVLFTGGVRDATPGRDTLYCYNADGAVRWRHGVSDRYRYDSIPYINYGLWIIKDFFVLRRSPIEKPQVFALAYKTPSFVTRLVEVDANNGSALQTYDHIGGLDPNIVYDLDGDGKTEILLGGINNAYQRACLVVLDPAHIEGVSPTKRGYRPVDRRPATEKYYLLLPFTIAGQLISGTMYNNTSAIIPGKSTRGIIVATDEVLNGPKGSEGTVLYTFDSTMTTVSVTGGDNFTSLWNRLRKENKVQSPLDQSYWDRLRDSLLYWDGEEFQHLRTTNKHYKHLSENF